MKPNGVQRSVRAQRFDRAAGDAPNIGRVARVPGTGLPKGKRRRKKRSHGGRGDRVRNSRRRVIVTWSAVFAVFTMGVLGVTLWLWMRPQIDPAAAENEKKRAPAPEAIKLVASRFPSPSRDAALDLVKRALVLRDPGKVAEIFRPGTASPEAVVDFLSQMEERDGKVTNCDWLSSVDANGLLIDGVVVRAQIEGRSRYRMALLTPDAAGVWKIDFDAFARTVSPAWSELLAAPSEEGLVRVTIAPDSYYNGPFRDDTQWTSYVMTSPDLEVSLSGYCRQGSPQAAALARIVEDGRDVSGGRSVNRATLKIRQSGEKSSKQFEITRVLAQDWVLSATPFDENFK